MEFGGDDCKTFSTARTQLGMVKVKIACAPLPTGKR